MTTLPLFTNLCTSKLDMWVNGILLKYFVEKMGGEWTREKVEEFEILILEKLIW